MAVVASRPSITISSAIAIASVVTVIAGITAIITNEAD